MKSSFVYPYLYSNLWSAIAGLGVVMLSELEIGVKILIWLASVILINTTHTLILHGIVFMQLKKQSITSGYFLALLPWMIISLILLINISQPDVVSLCLISSQLLTAGISYHHYLRAIESEKNTSPSEIITTVAYEKI